MSAPWPTPVPNRYMVQVRNVHDEWTSIAGNITRQPITPAYLGGSGVARGEAYRVIDATNGDVIASGVR